MIKNQIFVLATAGPAAYVPLALYATGRTFLQVQRLSLSLEDIIFEEILCVGDRTLAKVSSSTLFDAKEEEEEDKEDKDETNAKQRFQRRSRVGTENGPFEGEHDPKSLAIRRDHIV